MMPLVQESSERTTGAVIGRTGDFLIYGGSVGLLVPTGATRFIAVEAKSFGHATGEPLAFGVVLDVTNYTVARLHTISGFFGGKSGALAMLASSLSTQYVTTVQMTHVRSLSVDTATTAVPDMRPIDPIADLFTSIDSQLQAIRLRNFVEVESDVLQLADKVLKELDAATTKEETRSWAERLADHTSQFGD